MSWKRGPCRHSADDLDEAALTYLEDAFGFERGKVAGLAEAVDLHCALGQQPAGLAAAFGELERGDHLTQEDGRVGGAASLRQVRVT